MAMIYVRTRPGRRAFYEGKVIPEDKFIPVPDNPYIRRLINHHEDLEVEGGSEPKQKEHKPKPAKGQSSATPAAAAEPTQPVKPTS